MKKPFAIRAVVAVCSKREESAMKRSASTAMLTAPKYLVLAVLAASLVGQGVLAPSANASELPGSCQDILASNPGAPDGNYTIFHNNKNAEGFTVFCAGMGTGAPKEYLSLINTGGAFNFAQFGGAPWVPPTVVATHYTRIRLDPVTLLVDISDQTFATSTGSSCCIGDKVITSVPYGTASDCVAEFSSTGRANVDLTGTPFEVSNTFGISGYLAKGSVNGHVGTDASFDDNVFTAFPAAGRVVNLTGGGFCGATYPLPLPSPIPAFPPMDTFGGYSLQLRYVGSVTVPALEVANTLVTFQPVPSSFSSTPDAVGCPVGSVGKFHFQARLTDMEAPSLFGVVVQVANISGGNQLLTGSGLLTTSGVFAVPETAAYADGVLSLGETVDVPFTVCLDARRSFTLFVDVWAQVGP